MCTFADAGPFDRRLRWHDRTGTLHRTHDDLLDLFFGKDLAPPADGPDQREDDTDDAHGSVRDEAGEGQRDAQGNDHRPRRGRRKVNLLGRPGVLVVRGHHVRSNASSPRRSGR